jgi:alpha-beta hydrolase superfamily lysophospholipase
MLCVAELSFTRQKAPEMEEHGYVVYMFDKPNYGSSTREKATDQLASEIGRFPVHTS